MANCGSTTRQIEAGLNVMQGSSAVVARAEVLTYPVKLLQVARKLIDDREFGIAIVVCHMACEVAAERSFTDAFTNQGIADIERAMMKFVNGRNLATDDIRNLYNSLTGGRIHEQPFWQKFKESSSRRNRIMHAQQLATKEDAEGSHAACSSLVTYLGK